MFSSSHNNDQLVDPSKKWRLSKRHITISAWALYEFASSLFSMNIISLYFALWVTIDMHGEDIFYSCALSISMLLSAISAPILGAASDRLQKRMPFIIATALLCAISTSFIGQLHHLWLGLVLFAIANYGYQLAEVFYNALLPTICETEKLGTISGYGIGFGYFGTIAGLLLVSPFVLKYGRPAAFLPTACFYLLFALPCFFFVKDKAITTAKTPFRFKEVLHDAFSKTKNTITHIKQYKNLLDFMIAAFLALNAVSTIYIFMSVYIKKVIGFSDSKMITYYMICSVFAIAGSFACGYITDRLGTKRTFSYALALWCITLIMALISLNPNLFWVVGPLAGISLGSTWTSARTLVVQLSPEDMVGEVFGFYGLIGRSASIMGPLLWGASVYAFRSFGVQKYRITVFMLLLFIIAGLWYVQRVPEPEKNLGLRKGKDRENHPGEILS